MLREVQVYLRSGNLLTQPGQGLELLVIRMTKGTILSEG